MYKWQKKWWKNGLVVVKPWKMMEVEFGTTGFGGIDCDDSWTSEMEKECPDDRIINVKDGRWNGWNISKEMLLGPAFKKGEEIEVRDYYDEAWRIRKFDNYITTGNKNGFIIEAGCQPWKYLRPIIKQEKQEETKMRKLKEPWEVLRLLMEDGASITVINGKIFYKGFEHSVNWLLLPNDKPDFCFDEVEEEITDEMIFDEWWGSDNGRWTRCVNYDTFNEDNKFYYFFNLGWVSLDWFKNRKHAKYPPTGGKG